MQRMTSCLGAVGAIVVTGALAGAACEPECVDDGDCGIGNSCNAGVCVTGGIGNGGGGGGGEGEGEGEGDNQFSQVDDLDAVASMLLPSSGLGGPAELALVGQYDPVGIIDIVRTFDVVAGEFVANATFDLDFLDASIGGNPGRCNVDSITLERGVDPEGEDELWWSCGLTGLQQSLVDELDNLVVHPDAAGADLILRLVRPDQNDRDVTQRRVFARRGSATLIVEQVVNNVSRPTLRARDAVSVTFGQIAGLSLITETDDATFGDIVLVFDRAFPGAQGLPALVPIERSTTTGNGKSWSLAQAPWRVIELPANTHAVRVVDDVLDPANLSDLDAADRDRVNLEVYLPVEGKVVFARLETEMNRGGATALNADDTGFQPLLFELSSSKRPSAVPSSTDRILIEPVPGVADTVFYLTTNQAFGWKLRLHRDNNDSFDNDVERALFFDEFRDRPSAMVTIPGVVDTVWIALKDAAELDPITFDPSN